MRIGFQKKGLAASKLAGRAQSVTKRQSFSLVHGTRREYAELAGMQMPAELHDEAEQAPQFEMGAEFGTAESTALEPVTAPHDDYQGGTGFVMQSQSPVMQSPVMQSAVMQSAVMQSPVMQSPVMQSPVVQSPLMQSPVMKMAQLTPEEMAMYQMPADVAPAKYGAPVPTMTPAELEFLGLLPPAGQAQEEVTPIFELSSGVTNAPIAPPLSTMAPMPEVPAARAVPSMAPMPEVPAAPDAADVSEPARQRGLGLDDLLSWEPGSTQASLSAFLKSKLQQLPPS